MGICQALFLGHLSPFSVSNYPALVGGSNAPNPALRREVCDTGEKMRRSVHFSFSLLVCLLLFAPLGGAQSEFNIRNSEGLQRNPKGLKLSLQSTERRSTFHLYETVPIDLEFSSSQLSAYSIELDEAMNFAGSSNTFEVSPADTALVTFAVLSSPSAVCCDSMKHFLSTKPTILHRELSDYVRFEKPGTYSIFLVTNRVFRGLGKANDFASSKITLTSNVLTLNILPDDPEWDSQQLAESLRKLSDPSVKANYAAAMKRARKIDSETATDFAMANRVSQTELVLVQKALNALDSEDAILERVNRMGMESRSDLEMARKYHTGSGVSQPLLASTSRADLVVAAVKARAERPEFGVDYDFVSWWARFQVLRDHSELFRPVLDAAEHQTRLLQFAAYFSQFERDIIPELERLNLTKTGDAADVTAVTIAILKEFSAARPQREQ